jgi:hypothetical protein
VLEEKQKRRLVRGCLLGLLYMVVAGAIILRMHVCCVFMLQTITCEETSDRHARLRSYNKRRARMTVSLFVTQTRPHTELNKLLEKIRL